MRATPTTGSEGVKLTVTGVPWSVKSVSGIGCDSMMRGAAMAVEAVSAMAMADVVMVRDGTGTLLVGETLSMMYRVTQ